MKLSVNHALAVVLVAIFARVACAGDALSFFNNWFVTGDYAVAGVGLRGAGVNGWATGTINMTGVPTGADPIAAFLYWSTVETSATPSAANGYFNGYQIQGAVLGNPQSPNPPCWGSNGSIGPAGTTGLVYRADVLRYLPVDAGNIRQANGSQTVKLPDSGGNGNGPWTNGASLVVIYRIVVPGDANTAPLRAIVIYNGAYTFNMQSAGMTQTVAGFYQAAASGGGKITNIVANGQSTFASTVSANGQTLTDNSFTGAQQARWDNPTFNFNLATNASSFTTLATAGTNQTCLTWAAIVFSVIVPDSDHDGLLDLWETKGLHRNTQVSPATFGTCSDYPNEPCVNLPAMGANPNNQDIFIQIDWMHGFGDGTGGADNHGAHDHMPKLAALNSVASSFAAHAINVHFDVGNNYQGAQSTCGNAPCSFIVPAAYAQGGSDIDESTLVCHDTATHTCDYHEPYPVLSFEFGFASIRDGNHLLNISPHFAQNRKDIFRYSLFAHALAGPFDAKGHPVDPFTGQPANTPKSYSGIAHRPGGGFMVTLGLWRSDIPANDQVGSVQVQAGTLMHELGHNLGLGHAGSSTLPNCMPNYASVMNYLYQTHGLTDASGNQQVDYSYGKVPPVNEAYLYAGYTKGTQRYRIRFYGPLASNQPATQAAQVHCDGTPIKNGEAFEVRLESPTVGTPDWSNGTVPAGHVIPPLDLNYDGATGQYFLDRPDWSTLNLQQIASGYSFGGLSVGAFATNGGAYATDAGAFATDAGALATDGGAFATDGGAFATDGGAFATDGGAFATDGGAFATDGGAFATDAGDLDETTLLLSTVDPPPPLTSTNTISSIVLNWTPPDSGNIQSYNIYRCAGAGCTPSAPPFKSITGGSATPSFTDAVNDFVDSGSTCPASSTCYNTTYVYVVTSVATINSSTNESLFSKTATSEVPHLFVIADGLPSMVYGGTSPTPTFKVYGDVQGSLTGVTCAYSPSVARNAATYPIVCSGPSTTSPANGVSYNQPYLSYIPGTFTITQRPITVTAAPSNKIYDGMTTSPATPAITSGTLAYSDTTAWTESYDNKNVGATHMMTPAGAVNDGNGGNNYKVTFVSINGGVIRPAPASVTPNPANKFYGSPDPTLTGVLTGFVAADAITATYTRTLGETVAGSPYTISAVLSPGAALTNYAITNNTANFTINKAPASITPNAASKTYGTPDPMLSGTLTGFVAADNITATYTRTPGETVTGGPYNISASLSPTAALVNYNITYNTANFTISKANASVTSNPASKTYGTPDPAFSGTLTGFLAADGVTATYSRNPGETVAASPYTISATLSPAGVLGNYNITYNAANFTVNKANASVTSNPAGKTYGTPDPAFSGTLTGFLAADGVTATYIRNAGEAVAGSPYTISATLSPAGVLGNYNIIYNTANFTINKANASVTPNPSSKTYGTPDSSPLTTGTLTGFAAADGVTATYIRNAGETVAGSPYTISATLSPTGVLGNYNIIYNTANFTIGKAPATVALTNMMQTYTGSPLAPTVTTNPSGVAVSLVGAPDTNAGSYPVTVTVTDPNYSGSAMGMFVINKFPLTVSATGINKSFDGTANATVTLTDNRVFAGDTFTDSYTSASFADPNPGTGKTVMVSGISISGPGAANYMLTSTTAQTTANITIDLTAIPLNGPATRIGSTVRFTNAVTEASSAWLGTPVPIASGFSTSFSFRITGGITSTLADGFAFVIQNSPMGASAVGGVGGDIGYAGIPNSIAIEFDSYPNAGAGSNDPSYQHIGIQSNGTAPNSPDHGSSESPSSANRGGPFQATFADGNVHTATIRYNPATTTLSVSLDGTVVGSAVVNLSSLFPLANNIGAYVGFTAATGIYGEYMDLLTWTWN